MLLLLTASKKCAAQIPVDKDVLNYLFSQSAKAYYLDKDVKWCDSVSTYQSGIILEKDSIILGQSEKLSIRISQNEICDLELKSSQSENKKLTKQVKILKPTGISLAVIAVAQYVKSRLD